MGKNNKKKMCTVGVKFSPFLHLAAREITKSSKRSMLKLEVFAFLCFRNRLVDDSQLRLRIKPA